MSVRSLRAGSNETTCVVALCVFVCLYFVYVYLTDINVNANTHIGTTCFVCIFHLAIVPNTYKFISLFLSLFSSFDNIGRPDKFVFINRWISENVRIYFIEIAQFVSFVLK